MASSEYQKRGVSAGKEEVHRAIKDQDKGLFPGAFCTVLPDLAGDPEWCMLVHADGAGTKSSLAYLVYKETGDLSVFAGLAQDALVMNTDDLACVGAVNNFYISNTIGRNAHRVSGEALAAVIGGYKSLCEKLNALGVACSLTGGETADVGDLVSTLICDSTVTVRLKREDVVDCADITPGLAIVGLASFGKSSYETLENAGMGSNGLTAARHLLLHKDYRDKYPETYADSMPKELAYTGKYHVTDLLPGTEMTVGQAILSPTRTYLPVVQKILAEERPAVKAMVHCTGGGQVKCKGFGQGIRYVKDNLFPMPPLFRAIYEQGDIEAKEMYHDFNMGHRLEVYCEPEAAKRIIEIAEGFGIEARVVGHTEKADGANEVVIKSELGEFLYK